MASPMSTPTWLWCPRSNGGCHTAPEIGRRLLSAGRATEALDVLERAKPNPSEAKGERGDDLSFLKSPAHAKWEETYIEALEATGKNDEAQRLRWQAFEARLSADRLRAFLKRLPEFEEVEAGTGPEARPQLHGLCCGAGLFHGLARSGPGGGTRVDPELRDRWQPVLLARPGCTTD